MGDPLHEGRTHVFDDSVMAEKLPADVYQRLKAALKSGDPTSREDQAVIAKALFVWARSLGATSFAHWFFPLRGGGGAVGGGISALKYDAFLDLDWSWQGDAKPFLEAFPADRLFVGETDGSSFPNGGLRCTHAAAAFTTWDRGSPCLVVGDTLYIPCCFITQLGACIDEKTPLLRSSDTVSFMGLRLLKAMRRLGNARECPNYLGWEQEFFVVSADLYRRRPDLVNCGRTLLGCLPARHQQEDLNYFAPTPSIVKRLMDNIQAQMLKVGCPMNVKHNEVAPAQHEMSPIFSVSNISADSNALFMQVAADEAAKLGLAVLFHEKPFKGINGSGKHCNWSVGTDTGVNFFHPGQNAESCELYVAAVACLAFGLKQYNDVVRCCVAHAGNDHRLGAQEAPPAIISLYPGPAFEAHVDRIIAGGPLAGLNIARNMVDPRARNAIDIPAGLEDRNRTAPFPHCGNRFEFRAVGSSQNCLMPVTVCNAVFAAGMAHLAGLLESGIPLQKAVATMFQQNRSVIFTGNGYSPEWPAQASKRGLRNLSTTPMAAKAFGSDKIKALFSDLCIMSPAEIEARQELMYEHYVNVLGIEANTMVRMVETGILPACAKDLQSFQASCLGCLCGIGPSLGQLRSRASAYRRIDTELRRLKAVMDRIPKDLEKEAFYFCDVIKPQMERLRSCVDKAETMMARELYPYPTYEDLLYSHHTRQCL
mmetsp:Transcript_70942/g.169903  ORF Transcript_70942/g.169903 Transcript_70942/m.169903 type:complete len:708 (+) Transcript_70942:70-2193(+)